MERIGIMQWDENNRRDFRIAHLDEFKTSKVIFQLVQLGLLEKAEDQKPIKKKTVSENFFLMVETELKKVIGPLAPLISMINSLIWVRRRNLLAKIKHCLLSRSSVKIFLTIQRRKRS